MKLALKIHRDAHNRREKVDFFKAEYHASISAEDYCLKIFHTHTSINVFPNDTHTTLETNHIDNFVFSRITSLNVAYQHMFNTFKNDTCLIEIS